MRPFIGILHERTKDAAALARPLLTRRRVGAALHNPPAIDRRGERAAWCRDSAVVAYEPLGSEPIREDVRKWIAAS